MGRSLLIMVGVALLLAAGGEVAFYDHARQTAATAPSGHDRATISLHEAATTAGIIDATLPAVPMVAPRASDLPVIDVAPRIVHTVPDNDTPPPHPVTFQSRDGRPLAQRLPPASQPVSPPSPPSPAPLTQISGVARVADVVSLTVLGRSVQLFGVKPPQSSDRCASAPQMAARVCGDVAREALAARLRSNGTVFCRVPSGQRSQTPAAICTDASGVDLGGFLVAEGFALADSAQSYDYAGAENVARSFGRGLWRYR